MAKVVIPEITAGYASVAALNEHLQTLEDELNNKVLYRDNPVGEPNSMQGDLDMNGHRILNALASTGDGFVWRGNWTTGLSYTINDLVYSGGSSYICLVSHTASALFGTDLGTGKWQVIAAQGASGAGTGDMLKADNLAGMASAATSRANIGAASSGANSDITSLNNPATGAATATTQAANDNSTKVATTAYADRLKIATQVAPGADGNVLTSNGSEWTSAAPASTSIFTEDYDSGDQTITAAALLTLSHGMSSAPKLVVLKLKCTTADAGYAINDEVEANVAMNAQTSGGGQSVYSTSSTIYVRFSTAVYQIPHKTTGAPTNLLATSWRLLVRAYA